MDKEFVPYQQSLDMKELGFDGPCFGYYVGLGDNKENIFKLVQIQSEKGHFKWTDNVYHAPTFSQAFKFFREKYGLYSHVRESYSFDKTLEFVSQINGSYVNHGIYDKPVNRFETYEEAELACLIKLIEIVKNK